MKKFLAITFIVLLVLIGMSISVQAANVTDKGDLHDVLTGTTDEEAVLVDDINGAYEELIITGTKTLNLNGKTITLHDSIIVDGGKLTITGDGRIVTEEADPMIHVLNGGSLTLENGTYESTTITLCNR